MFKAMAKLNLAASVVKHRRAGSGAGGSRHGSVGDLSRAFEETTSVSSSPDLADVPRSLEEWAEQDSEDFDAGAFAAEHYGDAGERRVARLHAVLSALQEKAGDQMKQNVLDHHSAFVEVVQCDDLASTDTARALKGTSRRYPRRGGRAPRGCGAGCRGGETRDDENERRRVARRRETASLDVLADDRDQTRTRRRPRLRPRRRRLKIQAELETLIAQRAPHAALDAAKRAAFFAETLRASAASSRAAEGLFPRRRKTQTPPFQNAFSKNDPAAARALLTAAAGARRAATAMLAEMAREEEPFDTLETLGVPVSAREPTRAVSRERRTEAKETR